MSPGLFKHTRTLPGLYSTVHFKPLTVTGKAILITHSTVQCTLQHGRVTKVQYRVLTRVVHGLSTNVTDVLQQKNSGTILVPNLPQTCGTRL